MSDEPSERQIRVSPPSSRPKNVRSERASSLPLVLLVDDSDDNRLLYATTIAEAGYQVEQATNGQEALDKIGSIRPAVIIMDLSMPVLDGWETTRRIKADPRTADIVIIAVTGHGTHYGLHQAKDAGCEAVLAKPCLPEDLIRIIGALCSPDVGPHPRA